MLVSVSAAIYVNYSKILVTTPEPPERPPYDAAVPLRLAPLRSGERFDERAGLVRRLAPNVARVDAALAVTVPAGQGRRRIETIEVQPFSAPATMR